MKVSAIIAAYNEEPTIGAVVRTFKSSSLIGNVIVVSDGSTDRTVLEAKNAGADIVLENIKNKGKGLAIADGVAITDAPIIFLADADLYGFTTEHIEKLLQPVLAGANDMSVGLRDWGILNGLLRYLPLIGGERVIRRSIFNSIPKKYIHGFMLEESLNYYCKIHGLRIGTVPLSGLHIRKKMQKVGFWKGLLQYIKMWYQIIKAILMVRAARLQGKF